MKSTIKSLLSLFLVVVCIFTLSACSNSFEKPNVNKDDSTISTNNNESTKDQGIWESATYRDNTEFGVGSKTVTVEVKAENKIITFTIKTDKDTVGAALIEHGLIAGDESQYGLYVKSVNGMTADYDVDKSYWAFYINGEYAMTGVDSTEIDEGATYQLEYTK